VDAADRIMALPGVALTASAAFFMVSLANIGSRAAQPWAEWLFWLGLLLLYVPIALALLVGRLTRAERVGVILVLGLLLFLCEAVAYPLGPASFDEMLHARTAEDILVTGRLFNPNAMLPVSPHYPGLENVTAALQSLSGMELWPASVIVLGVARVLLMLSMFLLVERVADSARLAGLAVLVYAANPRFLYFDSQFAYESLGLPLAIFVLAAAAARGRVGSVRLELAAILVVAFAVVVTHPVTSAMLATFLVIWTVARYVVPRLQRDAEPGPDPALLAVATVAAVAGWAILVAPQVIDYIQSPVTRATDQIIELLSGEAESRTPFQSAAGEVAPLWERVVGLGSVAILVAVLPFGLRELWRRHRDSPLAWALAIVALAYPLGVLGRLSPLGAEIAARTPEFLFLGVGLCVAAFLTRWLSFRWRSTPRLAVVAGAAAVVLVGGVVLGIPRWARLPGPYLASADARSIEPNGIAAATWARTELGPDNRVIADRVNRLLMGVYGHQETILANNPFVDMAAFYQAFEFGPPQHRLVAAQRVRFAVVDLRLTRLLPTVGFYFQKQELDSGPRTVPLRPGGLTKFDTEPGLDRLFDNGDIRIYDVSTLGSLAPP
jgi:hypothetical protein